MNYVYILIGTLVTLTLVAQLLSYVVFAKAKKVEIRKSLR